MTDPSEYLRLTTLLFKASQTVSQEDSERGSLHPNATPDRDVF
jgi:hypothetical protein